MVVLGGGRLFMSEVPFNSLEVLGGGGLFLMSQVPLYSFASEWTMKGFCIRLASAACHDCMFLL